MEIDELRMKVHDLEGRRDNIIGVSSSETLFMDDSLKGVGQLKYLLFFNSSNFGVSPSETLSMDDSLKVVGQLRYLCPLHSPICQVQVRGQPATVSPVFVKMNFAQPIKEEPEAMDTTQPCVTISVSSSDGCTEPMADGKGATAMDED